MRIPFVPVPGFLNVFRINVAVCSWMSELRSVALFAFSLCCAYPGAYAVTASTASLAVTSGGKPVTSVTSGTTVALTATVVAGTTLITPGTVNFCDSAISKDCTGVGLLGTAQLTSAGTASLNLRLGVGSHSLTAVFVGTKADAGSTSYAFDFTVTGSGPYPSVTTISSAANATSGAYDLSAVVTGNGPFGFPAPTGTVDFLNTSDNNAQLASASLADGTSSEGPIFGSEQKPPADLHSYGAMIGDFNGDGIPDLLLASNNSGKISVLLGNGDGTFQAAKDSATSEIISSLQIGDFNDDGKLDVAILGQNGISILLGNGDGTFQQGAIYAAPESNENGIAVSDFNEDGRLDIVLSSVCAGTQVSCVEVFLGNGDGTFQASPNFSYNPSDAYIVSNVGDFNGDGNPDLVLFGRSLELSTPSTIAVLLGNGDGTFQTPQSISISPSDLGISGTMVDDFNHDGKADLAVVSGNAEYPEQQAIITVLLGNGDGTFRNPEIYALGVLNLSVCMGDFNGDGNIDFAAAGQQGVLTLLGKGDGTFSQSLQTYPLSANPTRLLVGDLNGDGKPDLAAANGGSYLSVLLNTAGPTVSVTASAVSVPGQGAQLIAGNYSGDSNYSPGTSPTITVTGSDAPVSWPAPAAITYGQALSATQLDATSTVRGTFVYNPPAGTVLNSGTQTLSVTFTPTSGSGYTPSVQTISLTVNPALLTATANNADRVYGAANPSFTGTITGLVNRDTLTETFTTQATVTSIVGSYPIVPGVSGSAAANYSITPVNGTLTITQAGTATTFALSNNNSMFTATVSSLTNGTPTGTVTFYEGQRAVGAAPLTNGVATYTASSAPTANMVMQANYSGDANFTQSASPAVPLFSVTPTAASLTVSQAGTTSDTLNIATMPGFTETLQFTCQGLPQATTCSFSPASITLNGTSTAAQTMLTIQTGTNTSSEIKPLFPGPLDLPVFPAGVLGLATWLARGRRRSEGRRGLLMLLLMLGALGMLTGCGGSSSPSNSTGGTPAGTSTVQVAVTGSGNLTQTVSLKLTVQ